MLAIVGKVETDGFFLSDQRIELYGFCLRTGYHDEYQCRSEREPSNVSLHCLDPNKVQPYER